MHNKNFAVNLIWKLCLELWPISDKLTCQCSKTMDPFGDHCLGCQQTCKTNTDNKIWDSFTPIFQHLLTTAKLISNNDSIEKEPPIIVPWVPQIRPFGFSFRLDQVMDPQLWHCPLSWVGFDNIIINSNNPTSSVKMAALSKHSAWRLQTGEMGKFERTLGASNSLPQQTLTADKIIGDIIDQNMALIPIVISPWGACGGGLFNQFLYWRGVLRSSTTPWLLSWW